MATSSDDVIWSVINNQFCAFKITTPQQENFCRNEYNVTGVCSRITCPLANSQYATVRSVGGQIYLYIKTPERQHLPNKWWQRIKLSQDYDEAQKQVDENLLYWPDRLVDRCKQRLTRLSEVQLAERRLALQQDERHYTTKSSKVKRREASRERKALVAAKLERAIERELLDRLKNGAYGEQPLNVDESVWKKVMADMNKDKTTEQEQLGEEEDLDEEEKEEETNAGDVEYVEDDEDDDDELVDVEDIEQWLDQSSDGAGSDDNGSDSDEESGSGASDDGDSKKRKKMQPKKRVKATKPPAKKRNAQYEYEYEEDRGQVARA